VRFSRFVYRKDSHSSALYVGPGHQGDAWPRRFGRWEYLGLGAVWAISGSPLRWVAAVLVLCGVIIELTDESLAVFRIHMDWRDRRALRRVAQGDGKTKQKGHHHSLRHG
jgi:hypothetical protein